MNRLLFNLTPKQNPYQEEPNSEYEIWGEIILTINDQSKTIEILGHQWDILEVYEWFLKNKSALLTEIFPFYFEDEKCIANCRDILYEKHNFKDLNEEIEYYDTIENYFSNHHFKLKGTGTPMLFIGLKNNSGEVSWFDIKKQEYSYFPFNMQDFIESTDHEFTKLFSRWHNSDEDKSLKVLERIKEIENSNGNHF
ncbi:hypothetical protein [Chryseobacterium vaccae]|uniref:hypothetical protein n=1 Tax=Chryseobacterium vaccae TaxID=2604424 RepID=UPI001294A3D6|nr:hypothetical protein [Chryseobacterium vaccae]